MNIPNPQAVRSGIEAHVDGFWPSRQKEDFVWAIGPIRKSLPDFRVTRATPSSRSGPWIYVSKGAWEVATAEGPRLEFVLQSPTEDPVHVETLAMVANFHADPKYRIELGKILNIGRPWVDGATCDHLLVSLPYLYGPAFEHCQVGGLSLRFLWLLPITLSEASFARRHGVEALEQIFEREAIDTLDPQRPSAV